jgi:hypothetical protein
MRIPCNGAMRLSLLVILLAASACVLAQQTLGGLTGTVTDASGAVVFGAKVQLTGDDNGVKLATTSRRNGVYQFQNLPVGTYTLVFTQAGFDAERVPAVPVQENRTGTINASLKVGSATTTIEVHEAPLLDQTDATNGYVLDTKEIQETPLATGSFTQLALLAPGVSAEMLGGIGTNAGLGNQPIWANGQRDTSNGFNVDGVDVTNLFNGKSSSEDNSQRYAFNIGQGGATGGQQQTNTSVYGSNGNGLATPAPEFIQEIRVNTSQYDSQQGNRSGAQIDVNTATGSNRYHGQAYGNRATNFTNAAPFFNKQGVLYQNNLPMSFLVPQLHRDILGGTYGGPILKDKLFFFAGYENQHVTDALKGFSTLTVPYFVPPAGYTDPTTGYAACPQIGSGGLTDDRSAAGIQTAINAYNATSCAFAVSAAISKGSNLAAQKAAGTGAEQTFTGPIDPIAMALLSAKLDNGQYLIPSVISTGSSSSAGTNTFLNGKSLFQANEGTLALDYNLNTQDRLSGKYYYQHSPDLSPFTNANTGGFPAAEDAGAQVAALSNSITIGPRINWEQRFGFSRQKVYSTYKAQLPDSTFGIGFPSGTSLPGLSLGKFSYSSGGSVTVGPNSNFANAGYFQNRWNPSTNLIFSIGKHNLSAGTSYSYTQLNVRNKRANLGNLSTANFVTFAEGQVSSSNELIGNSNRYYRANEIGSYLQDQWRVLTNLSITAGIRYDYDGAFTEKYGNMFNFEPTLFNVSQSTVVNSGFVVAGNNRFSPTAGVSNSTLTGRQWGIGPRLGFAFTPKQASGKLVVRGGFGLYFDRGELFSYLSQPAGSTTGGPFGVTEAAPLANYVTGAGTRTLENPLGTAVIPVSSSDPATFTAKLVTANSIRSGCAGVTVEQNNGGGDCGTQPYNFGAYARNNKLPYSIDYTFNLQYQLTKNMAATLGYTGNRGRHLVIPVPFNEPGIATATSPINGETSSYGYEVLNTATTTVAGGKTYYNPISTEPYNTYDGGNIDLRVPYVGYSPNATLYKAAGVSAYDALQAHLERRMSNYVSLGASYTYSHALDEQSDIGLFFTGDNPNKLRDSWASADFDRTHILVFNYVFQLPKLAKESSLLGKFTNGWQVVGITKLQSGQPYSLYEFDGAVGSLYFGNFPSLANPVLGIKNGSNPKSALTGHSGSQLATTSPVTYVPAIDPTQLQINYVQPGQKGVPACTSGEPCDVFENDFTPGQRNIFKQSFQKDADISFQKVTRFTDRYSARYTFDVYNVTNTTSFDVPNNSATVSGSRLNAAAPPTGCLNCTTSVAFGQVATSIGTQGNDVNRLYVIPTIGATTFGAVRNAIGQPRTIEMSLHLLF